MLLTSIFSFSSSVFYPIKERNRHFNNIYFIACKCFKFGPWENYVLSIMKNLELLQRNLLSLSLKSSQQSIHSPAFIFERCCRSNPQKKHSLIFYLPWPLCSNLELRLFQSYSRMSMTMGLFGTLISNPLPQMPILGSSNSAANKDMM